MLVNVDQLIPGGANLSIDIQRLAIQRLGEVLKERYNQEVPKTLYFQFDNCGENKNKVSNIQYFKELSMLSESIFLSTHFNYAVGNDGILLTFIGGWSDDRNPC
jgi:hypothetical protein